MNNLSKVFFGSFVLMGLMTFVGGTTAYAAADTCTWTGAADSNFSNAGNWSGCDNGNIPESADTVVFPNSAANKIVYKDTTYSFAPTRINVTGDNYIFDGAAGANELRVLFMFVTGNNNTFNGPIKTEGAGTIITEFSGTGNILNGDIELVSTIDLGPWSIRGSGVVVNSDVTGAKGSINIDVTGEVEFNGDNTFDPALAVGGFGAPASLPINLDAGTLVCGSATCTAKGDITDYDFPVSGTGTIRFDVDATVDGLLNPGNSTLRNLVEISDGVSVEFAGGIRYLGYGGVVAQAAISLGDGATLTISGDIMIPGAEVLQFTGDSGTTSTVIISGGNTTTAAAQVSASNTRITYADSAPALSSTLVVESGARLSGTDTVGVVLVEPGGFVAPGNSPGCLTTGAMTLGGTLEIELAGTTVCTEYDQLNVTAAADITGSFLTVDTQFTPTNGDQFTVLTSTALTGIFTGLPEGTIFTAGSATYSISYTATSVVLTAVAAPVVAPVEVAPTPPAENEVLAETGASTMLAIAAGGALLLATAYLQKVSRIQGQQ